MKKDTYFFATLCFSLLCLSSLNAQFGEQQIISTAILEPTSVAAADIDGDGFIDVISSGIGNEQLAWHKNLDGLGNFGTPNYITTSIFPYKAHTQDINADGHIDIWTTSGGDDFITWYENINGTGNFSSHTVISNDGNDAIFTDIDGDSDLDIFIISDTDLAWRENLNGQGFFGDKQHIWIAPSRNFLDLEAADLDNDDDIDIILSLDTKVYWFENTNGTGSFSDAKLISNQSSTGEGTLLAADIDTDGDLDLITAGRNEISISWYENMDGLGTYGAQQTINSEMDPFISEILANDIDKDGDIDIVSASGSENKIVWFENENAQFGSQQIITTSVDVPTSIYIQDLNNDTKPDLVSAAISDNIIAWYPNQFVLGIEKHQENTFLIYPNPVVKNFTIQGNAQINEITIYTSSGKKVLSKKYEQKEFQQEVLVENLSNGLYFVSLKSNMGSSHLKFLKY